MHKISLRTLPAIRHHTFINTSGYPVQKNPALKIDIKTGQQRQQAPAKFLQIFINSRIEGLRVLQLTQKHTVLPTVIAEKSRAQRINTHYFGIRSLQIIHKPFRRQIHNTAAKRTQCLRIFRL